jgi:hypothetical protein
VSVLKYFILAQMSMPSLSEMVHYCKTLGTKSQKQKLLIYHEHGSSCGARFGVSWEDGLIGRRFTGFGRHMSVSVVVSTSKVLREKSQPIPSSFRKLCDLEGSYFHN